MLDTALQITAEQGVSNVTMAAIATRMGVTRPVVYACYNGRSEVLTQLLERETRLALTSLRAILPPQGTGSVEQMFVDGFAALLGDVAARPGRGRSSSSLRSRILFLPRLFHRGGRRFGHRSARSCGLCCNSGRSVMSILFCRRWSKHSWRSARGPYD